MGGAWGRLGLGPGTYIYIYVYCHMELSFRSFTRFALTRHQEIDRIIFRLRPCRQPLDCWLVGFSCSIDFAVSLPKYVLARWYMNASSFNIFRIIVIRETVILAGPNLSFCMALVSRGTVGRSRETLEHAKGDLAVPARIPGLHFESFPITSDRFMFFLVPKLP